MRRVSALSWPADVDRRALAGASEWAALWLEGCDVNVIQRLGRAVAPKPRARQCPPSLPFSPPTTTRTGRCLLPMSGFATQRYGARAARFQNVTARAILETMERKQSNLCVSVDVTRAADLLAIVRGVAPYVCMVKTHIDIVADFTPALADELARISTELDVVLFEDRKFADIGNTVTMQYSQGVYRIADWAHLTNAHLVPGPGIIAGLAKAGVPKGRACLLLAQMSSKGNLCTEPYTDASVAAALDDPTGFVVGFIAMGRVDQTYYREHATPADKQQDFLVLTPGVNMSVSGDALGQQYRTPDQVVRESLCDVIIVGRGIYGPLLKALEAGANDSVKAQVMEEVKSEAQRYRKAGWDAYLARLV